MLKIFGASLISLAVSCIGFVKYIRLSKRVRYLEAARQFSFGLADDMRFNQKDIFSILINCKSFELEFFKSVSIDNIGDEKYLQDLALENGIEPSDVEIFSGFLKNLGTSDIEGQKVHCSYYAERFSSRLDEAKAEREEKGRVQRTIYLFAGAALFLILI